jgi:hypothetical protein
LPQRGANQPCAPPRPRAKRTWSCDRFDERDTTDLITAYAKAPPPSLTDAHGLSFKSVKRLVRIAGIRRMPPTRRSTKATPTATHPWTTPAGGIGRPRPPSRDFGLTEGSRDSETISLTPLGKQTVYPASDDAAAEAKLKAFLNVEKFRQVVEYYGGSKLPAEEFVRNTLETRFNLDPRTHDEFIDLFMKNCKFVGIGAEWAGTVSAATTSSDGTRAGAASNGVVTPAIPAKPVPPLANSERPVCFVIMPFVEKTDDNAPGFFNEVFASLFKPAIEAAGFEARRLSVRAQT